VRRVDDKATESTRRHPDRLNVVSLVESDRTIDSTLLWFASRRSRFGASVRLRAVRIPQLKIESSVTGERGSRA
jgi:hypothetical protein